MPLDKLVYTINKMKIVMAGTFILIMVVVALYFMPDMITATHTMSTSSRTDIGNITTGAGVTSATMTLSQAVYNTSTSEVASVSSDYGGDTPTASTLDATGRLLVVTGLAQSQTRELTVTYFTDALTQFPGASPLSKMGPTLVLLVLFLGIPAALILRLFVFKQG